MRKWLDVAAWEAAAVLGNGSSGSLTGLWKHNYVLVAKHVGNPGLNSLTDSAGDYSGKLPIYAGLSGLYFFVRPATAS